MADLNALSGYTYSDPITCPSLTIIIPAYNEEQRLPQTLQRILAYLKQQPYGSQVIVVDDGSGDLTAEVVAAFQSDEPRVELIRNDHRGKGYAIRTGVAAARGDIILFFDADSSTPIQDIEKLIPWFERGYGVVIGSREGDGAKQISEPFHRHFMGRIFNLVVQLLALRGIEDTQCGFKALRGDVAREIFARAQLYGDHARRVTDAMVTAYDVEVLFIAQKLGYPIKEVPVDWRYGTQSKVNPLKDSLRNFRDVLLVRWNDLRGRYAPQ